MRCAELEVACRSLRKLVYHAGIINGYNLSHKI